jgi:hypothetical protein
MIDAHLSASARVAPSTMSCSLKLRFDLHHSGSSVKTKRRTLPIPEPSASSARL